MHLSVTINKQKFMCQMHSEAKQSEMLELEQRKVYWRVMHGEWVSQVKKTPKLPVFRVVFTGKIWGEGETVYLSLGLESSPNPRNLVLGPNEAQVLEVSLQKEFSER